MTAPEEPGDGAAAPGASEATGGAAAPAGRAGADGSGQEPPREESADRSGDADPSEEDFAEDTEPRPDQATYDRMLWGIAGGLGAIGLGSQHNQGQSAVGHNPISIGSVTVTAHAGQGGARSWSGVLTAQTLARMSATYPLRDYDKELDEQLLKRHLLYLGGPAGSGRYTAACLAMERLHNGRVAGILLAPGTGVTEIAERSDLLTAEHGHVLQPATDLRPDPIALAALEARAQALHARVVVIGAVRGPRDVGDYLFRHRMPEMDSVFRTHLTDRLNERGNCLGGCDNCLGECLDRYVTGCLSHPYLGTHLTAANRIGEVIELAERIAAEAPVGDELTALLSSLLPALLRQVARQILRTTQSPGWEAPASQGTLGYQRAFRIAYAVFDGEPMTQVFEATDRLVEPRGSDRRPRLGWEAEALLDEGMVGFDDDPAAGLPRVARLRHPLLASAILDVAWNDWGLSERLLEWLERLVESPRRSTYERAAVVAGSLARYDFAHVYDGLIDGWAGHRRRAMRNAAALAVRATACDQRVLPLLSQRVRDWVTGSSVFQRDSAVRAYVLGLGQVLPYFALNDLREAAEDRMQRLNGGIGATVAETYQKLGPDLLVSTLSDWAAPAHPERIRTHAARAWVHLAARLAPDPRGDWPELLADAADGQVPVGALAGLWTPALTLPGTAFEAWRRLGYWISRAERDAELGEWMLTLMRELCADAGLRDRVRHHIVHVWRQQMPHNRFLARLTAVVEGDPT